MPAEPSYIIGAANVGDQVFERRSAEQLLAELAETVLDDVEKSLGEL
jgi:hypothetical protein